MLNISNLAQIIYFLLCNEGEFSLTMVTLYLVTCWQSLLSYSLRTGVLLIYVHLVYQRYGQIRDKKLYCLRPNIFWTARSLHSPLLWPQSPQLPLGFGSWGERICGPGIPSAGFLHLIFLRRALSCYPLTFKKIFNWRIIALQCY